MKIHGACSARPGTHGNAPYHAASIILRSGGGGGNDNNMYSIYFSVPFSRGGDNEKKGPYSVFITQR